MAASGAHYRRIIRVWGMMAAPLYSGAVIAIAVIAWKVDELYAIGVLALGIVAAIPIAFWWVHRSSVFKGPQPDVSLWLLRGANLEAGSNHYLWDSRIQEWLNDYEQWIASGEPLLTQYAIQRLRKDLIKVKESRKGIEDEPRHWLGVSVQTALRWHLEWLNKRVDEAD